MLRNKGADQLRGYREADLRLCFRICKNRFSHDAAQSVNEGVQCMMVLDVNFLDFLKLLFLCFVVAIFDLVYDVEAINDLY